MKDTLKLVLLLLLFGALPAAHLLGQSCFGLKLSSHTAEPGDTVCVEVSVAGFTNMVGMQHSVNWNDSELRFISVSNLNLPSLALLNFENSAPGEIEMAWYDFTVQGVGLADGTVIYELCFEVLAPEGTAANVWFADSPLPAEFSYLTAPGVFSELEDYALIGGNVLVNSGAELPLTINAACAQSNGSCTDGGSLEATVSGGTPPYSWSWTGLNFTSTNEFGISGIPTGPYELVVTDANNRTVRTTFQAGNSGLEITDYSIEAVSCGAGPGGISIHAVNGASGNLAYLWSTGDQTASISVSAQGSYSVTITDEAGCSLESSFDVPGTSSFAITETITAPVCPNQPTGAIGLSVSLPGNYTFEWSNNTTSQNISNLTAGNYSVTVTDTQSGCSVTENYQVTPSGLDIVLSLTGCDLPNDTVAIFANPTLGNGPYTYTWSNGATTTSIEVPSVQGSIYSVTIADASGCSDSASQTINCVNGQATLSLTGATVNPGESVCLDVAISNTIPVGAMALELNWDANILQFDSITNLQMPNPQVAGWNNNAPGVLDFLWADNSIPYPAQASPALLMEVCFTALQAGSTAVVFSADPSETYLLEASIFQQLALFTTGNTVTVSGNSQQAIGIRGAEILAEPMDQVCIPVKATNFEDLTHFSSEMRWDATQLEFTSIASINPGASGLNGADFNLDQADQGLLLLDWAADPGESTSLPNDATIYEVCFNVIGGPGSYPINWSNLAAQNANAIDLAVATIDGKVVAVPSANDNYVELSLAPGAILNAGQDTCIEVKAVQFDAIFAMQFSINWDPTLIRLDSVLPADLPAVSPSASFGYFPSEGNLTFSWLDPTLTTGATLVEGESLFNLCFSALGPAGISTLTFENAPTAIEIVDENGFIPFLGQGGFIIVPDQNVWPGDTDNNGHVNHFDLLPIGIGFGAAGPQRQNATIDWVGQYAEDWSQYTPSSAINYKHIDTNGDGVIAADDTLAVSQNWGLSVNPFLPDAPVFEPRVLGVPLYVVADTLAPSEVAALDIVLGTNDLPAENVYGIAFSITYNPELIVPGSVSASFLNSWLGQQNSDLISLFRVSPTQDRIDIAISRTDGLNNSGNGAIGKLHITIEDVIFRNNAFRRAEFNIENVRLIDRDELEIPVAPELTTSWVSVSTGTENPELAENIRIYPTPASEDLFLTATGIQVHSVQVLDQYGRSVANFDQPNNRMNIRQLPAGLYVARVTTDQGVAYKPVVVVR